MEIDDLLLEYGLYYVGNPANLERLRRALYISDGEMEATCTVQEVDATQVRGAVLMNGEEILQGFQDNFTPKGDVELVPNTINLYQQKINKKIGVSNIESSWAGFLAGRTTDRSEWMASRFVLEGYIIPQMNQDNELNAIYKGIHAPPTANVPNAAAASMNGFGKVIADGLLPTAKIPINVITTGTWSSDPVTFVEQIEAFVNGIPEQYRVWNLIIRLNKVLMQRYRVGKQLKYNTYYKDVTELDNIYYYPNIKLVGCYAMAGRNRIWCCTKENAAVLYKRKSQGLNLWKIEPYHLGVSGDWWKGVGFWNPAETWVNDLL